MTLTSGGSAALLCGATETSVAKATLAVAARRGLLDIRGHIAANAGCASEGRALGVVRAETQPFWPLAVSSAMAYPRSEMIPAEPAARDGNSLKPRREVLFDRRPLWRGEGAVVDQHFSE